MKVRKFGASQDWSCACYFYYHIYFQVRWLRENNGSYKSVSITEGGGARFLTIGPNEQTFAVLKEKAMEAFFPCGIPEDWVAAIWDCERYV